MPEPTCTHCGGTQIVRDIKVGQSAGAGRIGLKYTAGLIFGGTEPLLADLCAGCGTVARLYVQNPDRKWKTTS